MGITILALVTEAFGGYGGIALYNRDMLTALCEHPAVEEVVAIPRLLPESPGAYPAKLTYLTNGLGGKFKYVQAVLSVLKDHRDFDLILCGHLNLLPVSDFVRLISGAPLILATYGIDVWQPTNSKLTNILAKRLKHFYSISEITKNRFLEWSQLPAEAGVLIPNAIHREWYGEGPPSPQLLKRYGLIGKRTIMTLGRLSASERYKGVDEILDVMPGLTEVDPNIHYLVVGDGDDRQRLESKTRELGLSEHVTFTGRIDEAKKADVIRLSDAYVMPSTGEGFGFVFLEAMACGIPVVASKADGGKEAVRGGKLGMLVDPKDQQDIRAAILDVLNKPKAIPSGLEYFSFTAFKKRVDNMLGGIGVLNES